MCGSSLSFIQQTLKYKLYFIIYLRKANTFIWAIRDVVIAPSMTTYVQ